MAAEWLSADGQWRVTSIELDGIPLLKVETRGALGWTWRADATSMKEVTALVPLSELQEQP